MVEILSLKNPEEVDHKKLEELVKDSFGRPLVHDYFVDFDPEAVYIAQSEGTYVGAIVLLRTPIGIAYLDKFVVAKKHQGNGIGRQTWDAMKRQEEKIVWRARPERPINSFYREVCQGMQKEDGWNIYWVGLTPDELKKSIEYALSKRETLIPGQPDKN